MRIIDNPDAMIRVARSGLPAISPSGYQQVQSQDRTLHYAALF